MELNQLLHEMFIYENLVTLTLIFFNEKFISRNIFVQLNINRKTNKSVSCKKHFFRGYGVKNNNKNYLELSCFIRTRIEKQTDEI